MKVLRLDDHPSWDPAALLAVPAAALFGDDWPLVRVGEVSALLAFAKPTAVEQPVVVPGGVDVSTGAILRTRRDYSGPARSLGPGREQLRSGDLLIPRAPKLLPVLASKQHAGLSFSDGFLAIRPIDADTGLVLWAMLASGRGARARAASAQGTTIALIGPTDLLALELPDPARYAFLTQRLRAVLSEIPAPSHGEVARSWWRVSELPPNGDWAFGLVLQDPAVLQLGRPLGELAEITSGRRPTPANALGEPLPVFDGLYLTHGEVRQWAMPHTVTAAASGDVLVGEVGLRSRARLVAEPGVVGAGVLRVRPAGHLEPAELVSYLNSESAQALRASLVQGVVPRMTATALRRFPIPDLSERRDPVSSETLPLPMQLDRLLWK